MRALVLLTVLQFCLGNAEEPEKNIPLKTLYEPAGENVIGYAKKQIPFMGSVQAKTFESGVYEHLCGATIIGEQFVVTAAHCFIRHAITNHISVVVGSNYLNITGGVRHQVTVIKKHRLFYPLHGYDIALLKVTPKFKFDGVNVDKINYDRSGNLPAGVQGLLIGWGSMNASDKPRNLILTSFTTISTIQCVNNRGFRFLTDTEICGVNYNGRGACDGESGGPLVTTDLSILIGILSYGTEPCKRGNAYAFTRLSVLTKWIRTEMRGMS